MVNMTISVAYSNPYIQLYTKYMIFSHGNCLRYTTVLWYCLERPLNTGTYLSFGVENVFVLLGRRILDGKQGF